MNNATKSNSNTFSLKNIGKDGISFGYKLMTVAAVKMAIWMQFEHSLMGYSYLMHGIVLVLAVLSFYLLRKMHPTVFTMCMIAIVMPNAITWIATTEASPMVKYFVMNVSIIMSLATVPLIVLNDLFYSPTPEWLKRLKARIAKSFG